MEKTEDFEKYYVEVIMQGRTDDERSTLPLRSSKKAALNGYFCAWTSKLTAYEYKFDCEFRKPKPDMLLQAAKDFNIDLSQSYDW